MSDTTYRSDAIKAVEECLKLLARPRYTVKTAIEAIPSVDIPHSDDWEKYSDKLWKNAYERGKADRPQGEWKNYKDEHYCTNCGEVVIGDWYNEDDWYDFCPNCGARMFAKDTNVPNKKGADDERGR